MNELKDFVLVACAICGVVSGILISRIVTTLKELGEFLAGISMAMTDRKVSKEELRERFSEGRFVVNIWKRTPEKYKLRQLKQ